MPFDDSLSTLPPERQQAVRAFLNSSLADCPACGRPVTPVSPRRLGDRGLEHLDCSAADQPAVEPVEPVSAAVEARARRSDWG